MGALIQTKHEELNQKRFDSLQMMMSYLYCGGTESLRIDMLDMLEVRNSSELFSLEAVKSTPLTVGLFSQLLSVASWFQLGALQRHCEIICSQHINLDNAVIMYRTAKVRQCSWHCRWRHRWRCRWRSSRGSVAFPAVSNASFSSYRCTA